MILVVAEKPSVAREIAKVLGATQKQKGYIRGKNYCVSWALGHLVELQEPQKYDATLKRWSLSQLPFIPPTFKLTVKGSKAARAQFSIVKKLMQDADELICATDAGREGELIFRYIQQKTNMEQKTTKRLWINSLTPAAIREGFSQLKPLSSYNSLADAARCRSEADWIIGLNATRAYTVQHSHGQGVLSIGRVQTPVLAMIVQRQQQIASFVSEPFYQCKTKYKDILFTHKSGRLSSKEEALSLLQAVQGKPLSIEEIERRKVPQKPPLLFDLTELQKTMNKGFSYSASKTLSLAQQLYEKKLITYPRTDSKFLSDDIFPTCEPILQKLQKEYPRITDIVRPIKRDRRFFNSAKVSDHHAIIPTGLLGNHLSGELLTLFTVIVNRFLSIFFPPSIEEKVHVTAKINREQFTAKGSQVITLGWKSLYPHLQRDETKEHHSLPNFTEGESGIHFPLLHEGWTTPPKLFTEATLLAAMETAGREVNSEELQEVLKEKGLGTPATRAATIETLLKRDYIVKNKKELQATPKGKQLIALLGDQPVLISPELTGQWEFKLREIERGNYSAKEFMQAVATFTQTIIQRLHKNDKQTTLGFCPLCGSVVIQGTKGGYGCSRWRDGCPFRFHGEQFGISLTTQHVSQLLAKGRTVRKRKLKTEIGDEIQGYIALNRRTGELSVISSEEKEKREAIGTCPQCRGTVVENFKSYSCNSCNFTIWKSIAGKKISMKLAQVLLSKGKTIQLKGFKSKKGKRFSAKLIIKGDKVELEF